jgi:hypothetical protein
MYGTALTVRSSRSRLGGACRCCSWSLVSKVTCGVGCARRLICQRRTAPRRTRTRYSYRRRTGCCPRRVRRYPRPPTQPDKPIAPPARVALADLAGSGPVEEAVITQLAHTYYEQLGYEPSTAGALIAVCDMFFGRITDGDVHPAVGAGCIGWYSWMTEHVADHRVVLACNEASQRWVHTPHRSAVEKEIRAMAAAWQADHQSHVPVLP